MQDNIDREKLAFMHRWIWKKMDGPVGVYQDRESIDACEGDLFGKPGVHAGP